MFCPKNTYLKAIAVVLICTTISGCDRLQVTDSCLDFFGSGERPGFELLPNGMVRHNDTRTTWYRCPAGTAYQASRCQGSPLYTSWEQASEYAVEFSQQTALPWRLPTNSEMENLTEKQCNAPTLNPQVFGALDIENYWTSTRTLHNDMFRCVYYTQNGSLNCRELRTLEHPFLLVLDD